jgi:ribulose-phosphate 3-epimerase
MMGMNATICPTITASDPDDYKTQIERSALFAQRLHIDIADGSLTPNSLMQIDQIWWPGGVRADLHVMNKRPLEHLPALIALGPQLIILHAEAEGDFLGFAELIHRHGIEAGVALLPETTVESIVPALDHIDHVLIFSGSLGSFGGTADLSLLQKVKQLKQLKPQLEIGWDGGVNADVAKQLADGGVEVLNAGGFIQKSGDPRNAYATLKVSLRSDTRQSTKTSEASDISNTLGVTKRPLEVIKSRDNSTKNLHHRGTRA